MRQRPDPAERFAWLIGDAEHADFRDARELLRESALVLGGPLEQVDQRLAGAAQPPELIVVAQSRPNRVGPARFAGLRRLAPVAGIVSLLGSWCEGESRTGRPAPGTLRLYWHEFPSWWRRQWRLRAAGQCPDWARPDGHDRTRPVTAAPGGGPRGLIVLDVPDWDSADGLTDVLRSAGYATAWQPAGRRTTIRGAVAGLWQGGQLGPAEAAHLATFCQRLARDGAPVVALVDFPRYDTLTRAAEAGAAALLGMPSINGELVELIDLQIERSRPAAPASRPARAA